MLGFGLIAMQKYNRNLGCQGKIGLQGLQRGKENAT